MNIRQQLVECLEYAQDVEQFGDEIAYWQQQLFLMQNAENQCDDRTRHLRSICLVVTILSALFIVICIPAVGLGNMPLLLQEMFSPSGGSICAISWLVIATIAISGFFWRRSSNKLRSLQEENQGKRQQIEANIQQLQERLRNIAEFASEEGYFDIVPMDYFSSEMLEYCISVIDRKLATTLQEAFLLLEQELRRQEQMARQQSLYDAQAEQMERLTNAVNVNTMATVLASQERKT